MTLSDSTDRPSAFANARTTGVVWLSYFVIGILGTVLQRGIVVRDDAAGTAANLLAHSTLFHAGLAFDLAGNLLYVVLTIFLYGLFRRVDRNTALLATAFSLMGCLTQIVGSLLRVAPYVLLADNRGLEALNAQQLQAATLVSLRMYSHVFHISFVLFACFEIALGVLILKTKWFPRWLGWLWIAAGAGWMTFLWPPFATTIFPAILLLNLAEPILAVWLIVKYREIPREAV